MKILIVDDSVFAQQFTKKMILKEYPDADFFFANSGEDGFELFLSEKPDCVVTDLLMPGIGGQAMISMMRGSDKDCRIIVLSSDVQKAVKDEIMQLGVLLFINKPLNGEKGRMLNDALGGIT